jgi:flagellar assembly protein FliH
VANSSEWLAAVAAPDSAAPGWLALLDGAQGFSEALPFGGMAPASLTDPLPESAPEPEPAPEPDPLEAALAAAFAEGEAAGRAAAEAEAEARAARQRGLRLSFRALDEAALATLADDLVATVSALCEGVLGEAARDPDGLLARCRAAARRIGGAAETMSLHLHPDDIALIGAAVLDGWRVVADAALEPGSLVIEGPDGSVCDGPAEWRRAIAAAVRG